MWLPDWSKICSKSDAKDIVLGFNAQTRNQNNLWAVEGNIPKK